MYWLDTLDLLLPALALDFGSKVLFECLRMQRVAQTYGCARCIQV